MRSTRSLPIWCILVGACGGGDSIGPGAAHVSSVTISPDSAGVVLYDSLTLHAVARDASGHVLSDRVVSWSSSATGIVWVRSNGVVQPLTRGSATITANIEGVSGSAKIAVVVPINFIVMNPSAGQLPAGDTLRI